MIVDDLIARLEKQAATRTVLEVRVGLGYTAVQLDDGDCGLAFTFSEDVETGCTALDQAGTLAGRTASELAGWARSREKVTAAVGWAMLNALIEAPPHAVEADVRELIQVEPEDVVGMVGYFSPLVGRFRERAAQLHIFEQQRQEDPDVHTTSEAPLLLPRCDVVVISATTLINHTLDDLLTHVNKARQRVILGPSTPMIPEIFQKHGVTLLSGMQVVDPEYILRVVGEGGGTRRFGRGVRKLSVSLEA